jgi:thiamine pyrophosphokinase
MNEKKRVCIIANSPAFNAVCAKLRVSDSDLVIATDGAAHRLPLELAPHIICGDFDSLDFVEAQKRFPSAEFIRSECQETNDLEKCILLAIARGAREIALSCSLGGRIDQTVTTLSLLERYHREVPLVLYEGEHTCRVVSADAGTEERFELTTTIGDTISLVPRGDGALVSISQVRWPLVREQLHAGSRGVSNEATGEVVTLTVYRGVVFLFHSSKE